MSRLSRFSLALIAIWGACFVGFLGSAQRAHAQAELITQASTTQSNVTAGNWIYYQVSIPVDSPGWRLVLAPRNGAAGKAQLFVRKDQEPTTSDSFRAVTDGSPKTIVLNATEAEAGDWYVGVYLPEDETAEDFTLKSEVGWVTDLVWDPGSAENGTQVFTIPANDLGGTHHFRVTTSNSQLGLWRQVLKVTSGEANLYVQQDSAAGPGSYSAKSERAGSDGLVAPSSTSAGEGQTWYLAVQATANATWSIFAGEIFVRNLGELAANTSSSSGADVMPTEGWRFYRTTIPNNAFGWRMWLQQSDGSTTWDQTFRIRKNLAPHPATGADRTYVGQALEVPPYLTAGGTGAYLVSVEGDPGTAFRFDSRQQEVTDLTFGATSAPINVSGYLFRTYRFTVPPDRLGWEITTLRTSGNPDVAVRRGLVANPQNNDAFSEIEGAADDSLTLVQPDLSSGTFFVTVYSETPAPYSFQLRNRESVITPIAFTSSTVNTEPNRSGWRYFSITDINSQLGRLGWLLRLSGQVPGTEIAIRRNNLPGRWSGSNDGSVYAEAFSDAHSTSGILQRPNQQADVYYVGVYTPTAQLGSFTLQTSELTPTLSSIRTSQFVDSLGVGEWKYYRIDVPAQINGKAVRGWELRVTQSAPRLGVSIRRDQLPTEVYPYNWNENFGGYRIGFTSATVWPSGRATIFNYDWSGRTSPSYEPTLSMGMGQPLEPGTYYLGFYNDASAASSFAWTSKVVGDEGSGLDYEIKPLAFGGSVNGTLSPRGVAYYYVDVPEGKASQKFRLSLPAGHEGRMYIRKDQLPNIHGGHSAVLANQGGEYWLQLPDSGQTTLAAGRYYVMVAGEGQNPPNDYTIGTGDISFTLAHLGEAPVVDLGTVPAGGSVTSDGSYDAGEVKLHRFTVPAGTAALEVRLENRVGAPRFGVRRGEQAPGVWGVYGHSSGHYADQESESLATIPNPQPGVYSVAVGGTTPQTGSYRLRVTAVAPQSVAAAGSGSSSGSVSLVAGQRRYFAVEVPASYSGEQVLGWRLDLAESSGSARLRVRRGGIPTDGVASSEQTEWKAGSFLAVPSFLTAGTWYVEMQGVTDSVASVSSSLVRDSSMLRTWTMPDFGQATALTGLAPGLFADTGVAANGNALPGDQGVDLPAGSYHLYAVDVPPGNGGLLRTVLEAIGGNPDLYIRPLAAPSIDHVVPIPQWPYSTQAYAHALSGSAQTEYGSWVPYDVKIAQRLEPGRWYLLVFASNNTNARYRLRMSHDASPQLQNLSLNGGTVASQTLAGTDWRYYRVQMPTDPAAMPQQWTITFNQSLGSAAIFIRDTIPPGYYSGSLRDWWADGLNPGGYQYFTTAGSQVIEGRNLRPGKTYYIGVRANSDCVYSLSSQSSANTLGAIYGSVSTISASGGSASVNMAAGETRTWRVESPAEANRWRHVSTHGAGVQVYLREDFFPAMSNTDTWRSNGAANSSTTVDLYGVTRARTYYLTAVNTSGSVQPFALTVDSRQYGVTVQSTNGFVQRSPSQSLYDYGAIVRLTATPSSGYQFNGWSGDASGTNNPLDVTVDTNKTVIANFGPLQRTLTRGATNGAINVSPVKTTYDNGETVTLTAVPGNGYEFVGWSGDLSGTNSPATLLMSSDRTVSAAFALAFTSSALSPSGLNFTRGGSGTWFMQTEVKPPGVDAAARSGNTAHSSTSHIETTVNGPGVITYWRKVSSENGYDYLRVFLDGVQIEGASWSGEQDWAQEMIIIPSGAHTVRWEYSKDGIVSSGLDAAFIAQVSFNFGALQRTLALSATNGAINVSPAKTTYDDGETVTLTAVPSDGYEFTGWSGDLSGTNNPATLVMSANRTVSAAFVPVFGASALSPSGLTFTRGGNGLWFMQLEVKPPAVNAAAQSGNTAHSSTSYFQTTVNGPGTMTYWRKISSEDDYDFLNVYLDGVQIVGASWSGEQDWAQQTVTIPSGAHTVRWEYSKDSSVNRGMDAAFIAHVVYVRPGFSSWSIAPLLPENRRGPMDRNGPMNLPNFLSYSMALDPRTATPADMPTLGQRGTGTMKFIFRRAKNRPDADLRIMSSTNLSTPWTAADVLSTTVLQDGGDHEKVEATVGAPQGAARFFLRLQAEQK